VSFPGNDFGQQGELLSKAVLSDVKAKDATRFDPQRAHRTIGWWPQAGTVAKFILVVLGVIVLIGWLLTALNH
jgi:hypothetical protein